MKPSEMVKQGWGVVFGTKTARLFGCEVHLTWPFNVYVLLFTVWTWLTVNWVVAMCIPFALAVVYFNVLLHEFGHVFAARLLGYECKGIAILPVGGVAMIEGNWQNKPLHEAVIALAGPAVNVVLGLMHLGLSFFLPEGGLLKSINDSMLWVNVAMVAFNLLPVYPMDGGRLLRAGLSTFCGVNRGTAATRFVGAVVGTACAVVAVYFGYYFTAMILMLLPAISFLEPKKELEEMQETLASGKGKILKEKGLIVVKPEEYKSKAG